MDRPEHGSHCRHCESVQVDDGTILDYHPHCVDGRHGTADATWTRCPACAEADRIAEWCDKQSAKWYGSVCEFDDGMCVAFGAAHDFARGKS